MKVEPNSVSRDRMKGLQAGDSVAVHYADDLSTVMLGDLLEVRDDRIRLKVHGLGGVLTTDAIGCAGWDVTIPWSSIGFVRHTKTRIVDCTCVEDES